MSLQVSDTSSSLMLQGQQCVLILYLDLCFMYKFYFHNLSTYCHRQNRNGCVLMVKFDCNFFIFLPVVALFLIVVVLFTQAREAHRS